MRKIGGTRRILRWASHMAVVLGFGMAGFLQAEQPKGVDFAHDMVPLIRARCAECHTNGKYKGSFSLDSRASILKAKVVVPGKSGESELLKRITSTDPDFRMPPKGDPLTSQQVELFH